jgi:hypothetical protein
MADEHRTTDLVGQLTTSEWDELDRLRRTLGQETFNEVQQQVWNDYIKEHEPPYTGI